MSSIEEELEDLEHQVWAYKALLEHSRGHADYLRDHLIMLIKRFEWQPIETAPKNGIQILGYDGRAMTNIHYEGGLWWLTVCCRYALDRTFEPTHWMSLPAKLPED